MLEGWNVKPREINVADDHVLPVAISITRCQISAEQGGSVLRFTAKQRGPTGMRWTTWPVPVRVDGKVWRYTRLAVKPGVESSGRLALSGLPPGAHRIAVGDSADCRISIVAPVGQNKKQEVV
jgi:hypothetical protein